MDNKSILSISNSENKFPIIIGAVVIILVAAGIGFWYWQKRVEAPEAPAATEVKDGLGAKALEKTKNPLSGELPETNPFQVNTNPFK